MNCLIHTLLAWSKNKNLVIYYNGDHVIGLDSVSNTIRDYKNLYLSAVTSLIGRNGAERSGHNFNYLEISTNYSYDNLTSSFNLSESYCHLLAEYFMHSKNYHREPTEISMWNFITQANEYLMNLPEINVIKCGSKIVAFYRFKFLAKLDRLPKSKITLIGARAYYVREVSII